jgi:Trk K+ transport system NAD-binding subunit
MMEQNELRDHIILCGLGHVGLRILELLRPAPVAVIDRSVSGPKKKQLEELGVHLFLADAGEEETLIRAGIAGAKALIAATDSDEINLRIALNAADLNPSLPVVIRIFEQKFAGRLEDVYPRFHTISTSHIAAEHFVSASISEHIAAMVEIDGRPLLFCHNCPQGTAPEALSLDDFGLTVSFGPVPGKPCRCFSRRTDKKARAEMKSRKDPLSLRERWRRLTGVSKGLLLGCLSVFGLSVLVFCFWFELSLVDAVYFTVTVMTTTGFGDISLLKASPLLKLYGALVMISGAALMAVLYSFIADIIISSRIEQLLGRKRHRLGNHIIVVGLGNVGYRVADLLLKMKEPVIVIESDNDKPFVKEIRRRTSVVIGDARREENLLAADIINAKCITVATENDLRNLEIALGAKELNPRIRTILRAFDRDLGKKLEKSFGVDRVYSTSSLAAPIFSGALFHPERIWSFEWKKRGFELFKKPLDQVQPGETILLGRAGEGAPFQFLSGKKAPAAASEVITLKARPHLF